MPPSEADVRGKYSLKNVPMARVVLEKLRRSPWVRSAARRYDQLSVKRDPSEPELYDQRLVTTDSELFFLLMFDEGLARDAEAAVARATARVIEAARRAGIEPSLKLTAAFSNGETLFAVRFATDANAPTLYTAAVRDGRGRCLVSEPLDREGSEWHAIPPSSFVAMSRNSVSVHRFAPQPARLAIAG